MPLFVSFSLSLFIPFSDPSLAINQMSSQVAEQGGLVAVDCVVICCCCPCLVLQVTVFLFIRLPHKLAVKSKRIILKKLHKRLRKRKHGEDDGNVGVDSRDEIDNNCFWMEFDDSPERSQPLQTELQGFPAIQRSSRILYLESEQGNDDMDALVAQDMRLVFYDQRNKWLEDETAWKEMLERSGTFWFGSFWSNGDYLECTPEFNEGGLRGGEDRGETWIHPSSSRNLGSEEILEM